MGKGGKGERLEINLPLAGKVVVDGVVCKHAGSGCCAVGGSSAGRASVRDRPAVDDDVG